MNQRPIGRQVSYFSPLSDNNFRGVYAFFRIAFQRYVIHNQVTIIKRTRVLET